MHLTQAVKWNASCYLAALVHPVVLLVIWALFLFFCLICVTDQEHDKNKENEEETAEEDWEARHAGSAAEVTEAECQSSRAKE